MIEKILQQIFPTTCGMCGRIYNEPICNKCKIKIEKEIIGKIIIKYNNNIFFKYMYLFKYKEELRKIFLSYKFKDKIYLYEFFVKIILKYKNLYKFISKYDIIIPVPIHKIRKRIRGYNQCELIAEKLVSNFNNLEYRNNILVKTKNNLKQSSLNIEDRKINVLNVYKLNNSSENFSNKNLLIFDDIYTSGNTINECIKVIKKTNPKSIGVFTIFKD